MKHIQCITIAISISLVIPGMQAKLLGGSYLSPPGNSELAESVSEKDYLFNMFKDVPGFDKLEKLYSKTPDQKKFVIKILKIAKALKEKSFTINEFRKSIKVKIKDILHPSHKRTGVEADIVISTKDKKERYLVKKLKEFEGIESFFETTHRYPAWEIFQIVAEEGGYTGVFLVIDRPQIRYQKCKISPIEGWEKFFVFTIGEIGIPKNIANLKVENLVRYANISLKIFQTQDAKKVAGMIIKTPDLSLEIKDEAKEIIKAANVIESMKDENDADKLDKIYRSNLVKFTPYYQAIITSYYRKRISEILHKATRFLENSL